MCYNMDAHTFLAQGTPMHRTVQRAALCYVLTSSSCKGLLTNLAHTITVSLLSVVCFSVFVCVCVFVCAVHPRHGRIVGAPPATLDVSRQW